MAEGRLGARGSSRRSGYAFAHQEGFGELITSGKNMRLSSLALATFASKHSSSWIDTLRRKKHTHAHTPPIASGECSPAPSCVSGSVPALSNSSSVLSGSQDAPIEEETGTAPSQNTQPVLTSAMQTPPVSEAVSQASAQQVSSGALTPTTVRSRGGDSPGGWTISLVSVQVRCSKILPIIMHMGCSVSMNSLNSSPATGGSFQLEDARPPLCSHGVLPG